jgi:hypothetical protein
MIHIGIPLLVIIVVVLVYVKLNHSKKADKFVKNLTHEPDFSFQETEKLVDGARKADEALDQRVKDNKTAIAELEKDTKKVDKYKGNDKEDKDAIE